MKSRTLASCKDIGRFESSNLRVFEGLVFEVVHAKLNWLCLEDEVDVQLIMTDQTTW